MTQFVLNNWYLFLGLVVVLFMLLADPLRQRLLGIANIPASQAIQLVNRQNGVVVDVREPSEFGIGHIPNATNIPLGSIAGRFNELKKFKDRPVIVCCRSGHRSAHAAAVLRKNGFTSVHNLAGGMLAWQGDNLPTER
jgi:rhodanese-related sulfurtransferase